jgi:hypothetical protein
MQEGKSEGRRDAHALVGSPKTGTRHSLGSGRSAAFATRQRHLDGDSGQPDEFRPAGAECGRQILAMRLDGVVRDPIRPRSRACSATSGRGTQPSRCLAGIAARWGASFQCPAFVLVQPCRCPREGQYSRTNSERISTSGLGPRPVVRLTGGCRQLAVARSDPTAASTIENDRMSLLF